MELDRFAPTLGQNGTPCAILPLMIYDDVSLYQRCTSCIVINKTDQFPTRSNIYSCE